MTRGYAAAIKIKKCGNPEAVALVLLAMEALDLPLPERLPEADLELRRFSSDGAVVVRGTTASVFIGGTLIGAAEPDRGSLQRSRCETDRVVARPGTCST
jgi:hypothetical protein